MGYQTVKQVPTLRDYNEAKQWWERTKPIRGRSNDLRPLAERRYADCYSIRKNSSNDAIECVLYKTPVVSFIPNGEVHIRNGGYASASTHKFIEEAVGTGVKASGQRGKTIIKISGSVVSLGANEVMRLRKNGSKYEVLDEQTHYDYRINRRGANNVRGRFKGFYDYLSGFIKLRAQEHQGQYYGAPMDMIECSFTELADSMGTAEYWDKTYTAVDTFVWRGLTKKPNTYREYVRVPKDEYERTTLAFLELIRSDQPEETKHTNFHKAALVLMTYGQTSLIKRKAVEKAPMFWFMADTPKTTLDTTLFKWFAPEVLERYEVPKGKIPSNKYTSWIEGEK